MPELEIKLGNKKAVTMGIYIMLLILSFICGYSKAEKDYSPTDEELFNSFNEKLLNYPPFPFSENQTFLEMKSIYFGYLSYPAVKPYVINELREVCKK